LSNIYINIVIGVAVLWLCSGEVYSQDDHQYEFRVASNCNLVNPYQYAYMGGLYQNLLLEFKMRKHQLTIGVNHQLMNEYQLFAPNALRGRTYNFNITTPVVAYSFFFIDNKGWRLSGGIQWQYFYTHVADCYTEVHTPGDPYQVCADHDAKWNFQNFAISIEVSKKVFERLSVSAGYCVGVFRTNIRASYLYPEDYNGYEWMDQFSLGLSFLITKPPGQTDGSGATEK